MAQKYYIQDMEGNFYRLNAEGDLVFAGSTEEAGVFTLEEVSKRITGKKSHYYKVVATENMKKICSCILPMEDPLVHSYIKSDTWLL